MMGGKMGRWEDRYRPRTGGEPALRNPIDPFFGRFEHGQMVKTVVRPDYDGIPFLITSSTASMNTSTSRMVV